VVVTDIVASVLIVVGATNRGVPDGTWLISILNSNNISNKLLVSGYLF